MTRKRDSTDTNAIFLVDALRFSTVPLSLAELDKTGGLSAGACADWRLRTRRKGLGLSRGYVAVSKLLSRQLSDFPQA